MLNRTAARELAFELIFEKNFRDESITEIIANAIEAREIVDDDFAKNTAINVFENIDEIDSLISANLQGWTINRISKVALAVLRLSVYEIKFSDEVPVSVSINEAVELAKKFGGDEDSAYVNGVLGTIARMGDE